ncbi:hypothetical protein Achl_3967 (plasmid) [Pseudarthrobacter chlorophenolicus A6]|uniref:Uncharacterized protein n=1 Tax=Pseudarthrobacter chlorophenolicus (strain ATCC 700700 / DSM 12829 / CIP 107037 / JCM 12360 / KCTC 9906 / NCIMB 13794 / A6) TaxID=452863 RepID=B8HHM1_PSECP|nr:hypothetical protein Achl_3967 [Pseudarthrobacter chlorophenolicus A6]SDQ18658.1 hypothetical protein SAMN04489738_0578 [Pseudarthrobacter chlorophenolicus]
MERNYRLPDLDRGALLGAAGTFLAGSDFFAGSGALAGALVVAFGAAGAAVGTEGAREGTGAVVALAGAVGGWKSPGTGLYTDG